MEFEGLKPRREPPLNPAREETPMADLRELLAGEDLARRIINDRLAFYGYTPDEIATTDAPPNHTAECELTDDGWECFDEDSRPFHPAHTDAALASEEILFVLEHPALIAVVAQWLRDEAVRLRRTAHEYRDAAAYMRLADSIDPQEAKP